MRACVGRLFPPSGGLGVDRPALPGPKAVIRYPEMLAEKLPFGHERPHLGASIRLRPAIILAARYSARDENSKGRSI